MRASRILSLLLMLAALLTLGCAAADDDDDSADDDQDDDATDDDDSADDDDTIDLKHAPLLDNQGREIVLHGANYMAVESHALPENYEQMADQWGFNAVRILITWSALEPEPGVYDEDYLSDVVEPQVEYASAAGLNVILDMHQYHWSTCCGGMGMPEWTCGQVPAVSFEWLLQSGLFWFEPEQVDAFVAAWGKVAEHFAGDERVFAYDLFNEPMAGLLTLPWTFENQLLRPLYLRLIDEIRQHDDHPYLMIEPSIISVGGLPSVLEPIDAERLIYAPHLYPGLTAEGGGYDFPKDLIWRHLERRKIETDRLGLPLLIGESGLRSSALDANGFARDVTELADLAFAHWTWWAFGYDDGSMGLCEADGDPKPEFFPYLTRPFPRATTGYLTSYRFAPELSTFELSFINNELDDPRIEIFVNAEQHYPDGFEVQSSDPDGSWSFSFDEQNNLLSVTCDPAAFSHTVTLAP